MTQAEFEKLLKQKTRTENLYNRKLDNPRTATVAETEQLKQKLNDLERKISSGEKSMAKRRLSMSKKNVEARKRRAASKKKTSKKKTSKKRTAKKRGRKKASKKKSRKGRIPLEVLEKRQARLTNIVKRRGGKVSA